MQIQNVISIFFFENLPYDDTLALLVLCNIVFILIPYRWNSHQQPVFCNVWHTFHTEFRICHFHIFSPAL